MDTTNPPTKPLKESPPKSRFYKFHDGSAFLRTSRIKTVQYRYKTAGSSLVVDFWSTKANIPRKLCIIFGWPSEKDKRAEVDEKLKKEMKRLCENFPYLYPVFDVYAFDSKTLKIEMVHNDSIFRIRFVDQTETLDILRIVGNLPCKGQKKERDRTVKKLLKL